MKGFSEEEKLIEAIQKENETEALALIDSGKINVDYVDRTGFTPLVYAHRSRLQKVVKSLYDHHAKVPVDQLSLMNKMFRIILEIPKENPYLNVREIINYIPAMFDDENTRTKKMISRALYNGLCYGFSALMLFMSNRGKEAEYSEMLKEVASWNGEEETLLKLPGLKEKIRQLYDNVFFLAWLQSWIMMSPVHKELANINQLDLHVLINLMLDAKEVKYRREFDFLFTFKQNELIDLFDKTIFANKMVRLNFGRSHWIGVIKKEDGYHFYDPESTEGPIVLKTTNELVEAVIKSYQCYYSRNTPDLTFDQNSLYDIGLCSYDKEDSKLMRYPSKEALLTDILKNRGTDSLLNAFSCNQAANALQLADSFKDWEMVEALLKQGVNIDIMTPYGMTLSSLLSPNTLELAKKTKKFKI